MKTPNPTPVPEKEKKPKHLKYCAASGLSCLVNHLDEVCPDIRDCEACKIEKGTLSLKKMEKIFREINLEHDCECRFCGNTFIDVGIDLKSQSFNEGYLKALGDIEMYLDDAEQDKEMADDPTDPKVRIAYFKYKLEELRKGK